MYFRTSRSALFVERKMKKNLEHYIKIFSTSTISRTTVKNIQVPRWFSKITKNREYNEKKVLKQYTLELLELYCLKKENSNIRHEKNNQENTFLTTIEPIPSRCPRPAYRRPLAHEFLVAKPYCGPICFEYPLAFRSSSFWVRTIFIILFLTL